MKLAKNPSGEWVVKFKTEFGRRTIGTGSRDRRDAERIAREAKVEEIERAARVGQLSKRVISQVLCGRNITVARAIDEWDRKMKSDGRPANTIHGYVAGVRAWCRDTHSEERTISNVTDTIIADWINDPARSDKRSNRQYRLATVKRFFKFCASRSWCLGNPADDIAINTAVLDHEQMERRHRGVFTDRELVAILRTLEPGSFWHCAVLIGRHTGLRLTDVAQLEWACFSQPGRMSVWTDKRDKRVSLPLEPNALAEAVSAIPILNDQFCFPEQREIATNPERRSLLSKQFGRLCEAARVFGRTFHDLRSTYCTAMERDGIPVEHIARAVGHSDTSVTRGYIVTSRCPVLVPEDSPIPTHDVFPEPQRA